jgi:arylsulfatase A-like enzyme
MLNGKTWGSSGSVWSNSWRLFVLASSLFSGQLVWSAERPNVVVILTDDQRADALGCAGHPYLKTPHIDRLAAEGTLFTHAFCTTSLCSPSRASILSGLYAHSHGVVNNFTEYPVDLPSFPRNLQAAGYATAYLGKWHMGEDNDGKRPGFDYFVTHKGQGKYYDTEFNVDGERKVVKGYYTHVVTDMALEWLHDRKRASDKPFLLMMGHKAPHSFYVPEPKYAREFDDVKVDYPASALQLGDKPAWFQKRLDSWHGIYGPLFDFRKKFPDRRPEAVADFAAMTRAYWATIRSVDDSVGRLYETLREMGQLDNTLFIFLGDNGLLNGEHGMVDKRTMHEASIRVPLVVRYPKLATASPQRKVSRMVLHVDVAPSILDICGVAPLPKSHGRSWKPLLTGSDAAWRSAWYYEYNYEKQFPYTPNVRGVRTERWKYIRYPHGDGGPDRHEAELYDLANDPDETKNLIRDARHVETVKELQERLLECIRETDGLPDKMPLDEGILDRLPDQKIR